jgi:hypothetical protein
MNQKRRFVGNADIEDVGHRLALIGAELQMRLPASPFGRLALSIFGAGILEILASSVPEFLHDRRQIRRVDDQLGFYVRNSAVSRTAPIVAKR